MDPAIVIRDIRHIYGDDLTVPQAIARLCGGGPVAVTVTDPADTIEVIARAATRAMTA